MTDEAAPRHDADDRQPDAPSRRRFLMATTGLAGLAVTGTLAAGGAAFVLGTEAGRGLNPDWATAAALDELPDGEPVRRIVDVIVVSGWAREVRSHAVWLLRRGSDVRAWSAVCPHEGCPIVAAEDRSGFRCRCHGSSWGLEGERLGGPTPRAMDDVDLEVSGGGVRVRPRRSRSGAADRDKRG